MTAQPSRKKYPEVRGNEIGGLNLNRNDLCNYLRAVILEDETSKEYTPGIKLVIAILEGFTTTPPEGT
jgi:hypothetical protein